MTAASPQIGRLARLLGVETSDLHELGGVSDEDLRALHDRISGAIFGRFEPRFARIAGLSKALPGPVAGKLAERFLPPTLGARCAELLEPAKARDLVGRVSVTYLADLALALNPARAEPVLRAIPAAHIGPVARELFRRREYGAMAEFVGAVNVDALEAALSLASAEDLLHVVPLLEWNAAVDAVVDGLPDAMVEQLARDVVATREWERASVLVERLNPVKAGELVARVPVDALAALAGALEPERVRPVVAAIPAARVGELARVLFAAGEHAALARFVGVVGPEQIEAALEPATGPDLLRIVPLLEWNPVLDAVVGTVSSDKIDAIFRDVVDSGLWAEADQLVERLPAPVRERMLDRVGALSTDTFDALQAAARDGRLTGAAADLVDRADRRRTDVAS